MHIDLEKQDITNLLALIANATIKGQEAPTVTALQAKLSAALKGDAQIDEIIEK